MSSDFPHTWYNELFLGEFWYNSIHYSSINMSPFEALYGYPAPLHIPYFPKDSPVAEVDTMSS